MRRHASTCQLAFQSSILKRSLPTIISLFCNCQKTKGSLLLSAGSLRKKGRTLIAACTISNEDVRECFPAAKAWPTRQGNHTQDRQPLMPLFCTMQVEQTAGRRVHFGRISDFFGGWQTARALHSRKIKTARVLCRTSLIAGRREKATFACSCG